MDGISSSGKIVQTWYNRDMPTYPMGMVRLELVDLHKSVNEGTKNVHNTGVGEDIRSDKES